MKRTKKDVGALHALRSASTVIATRISRRVFFNIRFWLSVFARNRVAKFANRFAYRARGLRQPIRSKEQHGYQKNDHNVQWFRSEHFTLLIQCPSISSLPKGLAVCKHGHKIKAVD